MADTATVIARIRTLIDDAAGDKSVFKENLRRSVLGNQVDGANKNFQLNNKRIVASSLSVSVDGASFAAPASEDDMRGRFTVTTAPATSLLATYDFQFFTDAEITIIIDSALSFVGATAAVNVDAGLLDALVKWAAGDCFEALSSRAGPLYDASAGGKSVSKASIKQHYLALAKQKHDEATAERDNFYKKKGEQFSPAYGKFALKQTPYTPRR